MENRTYEESLVFAAKHGNDKCFEELYNMYYQKVYALARTTMKNDADAEDVLQLTFISAWKNISKLDDDSAFNTWIQRITLNQCYTALRKRKGDISIELPDDDENSEPLQIESDVELPEVYAERGDLKLRLGRIIDDLSDVQRQTIMLFYFDDMSIEEIARAMDCSENTVKSRLFLARKAIKTEVEEQERRSGEKFYGVVGLPIIPFAKIFISQVKSRSIPSSAASRIFSNISANTFTSATGSAVGTAAGNAAGNTANTAAQTASAAGSQSAGGTASSVASQSASTAAATAASGAAKGAGGFMSSVAAKIVAGIIGVGIVAGGVAGTVSLIKSSGDTGNDTPNSPDDYYENEVSEDFTEAYSSYLDLLINKKEKIDKYYWQKSPYGHVPEDEEHVSRPVVLCDVYGDDTPELIYLAVESENGGPSISLNIETYENGIVRSVYYDDMYIGPVAGGIHRYSFYRLSDGKELCVYEQTGDDSIINTYYTFREFNSLLSKDEKFRAYGTPNPYHSEYYYEYTRDGSVTISESEYEDAVSKIEDDTSVILIYSTTEYITSPDFVLDFVSDKGCPAMTCQEAIDFLRGKVKTNTNDNSDGEDNVLFADLAGEYKYYSGAGGWETEIEIGIDGTFTGVFQQHSLFDYPIKVSRSEFHGSFSSIQKISENEYVLELDPLIYDSTDGEVKIEDNTEITYSHQAPGLERVKTFRFYPEGTPVSSLPDEAVRWYTYNMSVLKSTDTVLPFKALYSADDEVACAFYSTGKQAASENKWIDAYRDLIYNDFPPETEETPFFPGVEGDHNIDTIWIGLKDTNDDNVPEMFISNEAVAFGLAANYVYTVDENGELLYLGEAGYRYAWVHVDESGKYPGVFSMSGNMGIYYCYYYYVKDNEIVYESVFSMSNELGTMLSDTDDPFETGESEVYGNVEFFKRTDDLDLYYAAKKSIAPEKLFTTDDPNPSTLNHFSVSEIKEMGFDEFIKESEWDK